MRIQDTELYQNLMGPKHWFIFDWLKYLDEDECTPAKMAAAGFYACGGTQEPDLARYKTQNCKTLI